MHGHSFEPICNKFGTWHPYVLRMVTCRLASAARARRLALRVVGKPLQITSDKRGIILAPTGNLELAGCKSNGVSVTDARSDRAL